MENDFTPEEEQDLLSGRVNLWDELAKGQEAQKKEEEDVKENKEQESKQMEEEEKM